MLSVMPAGSMAVGKGGVVAETSKRVGSVTEDSGGGSRRELDSCEGNHGGVHGAFFSPPNPPRHTHRWLSIYNHTRSQGVDHNPKSYTLIPNPSLLNPHPQTCEVRSRSRAVRQRCLSRMLEA